MILALYFIVVSPYTAVLPVAYTVYKVLSRQVNIYANPWNVGILLLFFWSAIVGVINLSPLSIIAAFVLFMYFCLSVYLQNHFYDEESIDLLLKRLVYFSVFSGVFGIIEGITFTYTDITIWESLFGIASEKLFFHRIYSTFGNPNVTGNWFAILALVSIYLGGKSLENRKLFYRAATLIFVVALYLTGSRGAYISLIGGILVYNFIKKDRKDIIFSILVYALLMILIFEPLKFVKPVRTEPLSLNVVESSIVENPTVERETVLNGRDTIWRGSIRMIKLKPLTGWGLMGFFEFGPKYTNYEGGILPHGHNIWITFTTTLGAIGLSIYLYMKFYLYRNLKMLYTMNCRLVPLFAGIQVLIVIHGMVDFTLMAPQTGIMFMSCSALISSLAMNYNTYNVKKPVYVA